MLILQNQCWLDYMKYPILYQISKKSFLDWDSNPHNWLLWSRIEAFNVELILHAFSFTSKSQTSVTKVHTVIYNGQKRRLMLIWLMVIIPHQTFPFPEQLSRSQWVLLSLWSEWIECTMNFYQMLCLFLLNFV